MHITLVSPFDPMPPRHKAAAAHLGGVERVFAEVAKRLAQRGHDVSLLCSCIGRAGVRRQQGLRVVRRRRIGTLARAPVARLAAAIPDDAQVVQVAATYPFTTTSVLREAKRRGIPAVLDFHFEPSPPTWPQQVASRAYSRRARAIFADADAVLVRSLAYAATAPSLADVPPERLQIIPNGFDTDRFKPDGPSFSGPYILFVGRLVSYKGLDVLLRAMVKGNISVPLVVVGDGPLRRSLQVMARRLHVEARFIGHVADRDLPALYRGARLTVLPSRNGQEAFGMVLVESMACGTPVLASALPGVAEVAKTGGWTAPPEDVDVWAHRLAEALDTPVRLDRHALARRVQSLYGWDAVVDQLESVYESLVRSPECAAHSVDHAHPRGNPVS